MDLEFRSSKGDGLIVSLLNNKDAETTRMTLELRKGKVNNEMPEGENGGQLEVVFSINHATELIAYEYVFKQTVCDSNWHTISMNVSPNEAILTIDQANRPLSNHCLDSG